MRFLKSTPWFIAATLFASYCNAATAASPPPKPKLPADAPVLVVVIHDVRPYVVSGENKETFAGYSRSLYGIPYHEELKFPLAKVLGRPMSDLVRERGFRARVIEVSPFKPAVDKLVSLQRPAVLVELAEWKTDKLIHTTLTYDVTLKLLSSSGEELASAHVSAPEEYIGGKQREERQNIDAAVRDIFATLLDAAAVQKGLQGLRANTAVPPMAQDSAEVPAVEKTAKDAWTDCKAAVKALLPAGTQVGFPPYEGRFLKESEGQRFLFAAQVSHLDRGKSAPHTWQCEAAYVKGQLVDPIAYLDPLP